jgi:hypothetical protein
MGYRAFRVQQTAWCHVPEDSFLNTECHENLKPHTFKVSFWNMHIKIKFKNNIFA